MPGSKEGKGPPHDCGEQDRSLAVTAMSQEPLPTVPVLPWLMEFTWKCVTERQSCIPALRNEGANFGPIRVTNALTELASL